MEDGRHLLQRINDPRSPPADDVGIDDIDMAIPD